MTKLAYSYVRMSTAEQLKGDSLRRQIELSARWAAENGYQLDTSLRLQDLGVSAFKGDNAVRGKLGAFLQAVDSGKVKKGSVLLLESLDRLTRQQISDGMELFLGILNRGIKIITMDPVQVFDRENLSLTELIVAIVELSRANSESEIKSSRVGKAWEEKRKQITTTKLTGRCPGWLKISEDKTKFILIPEHVKTVKRIFHLSKSGYGVTAITRILNSESVPTLGYGTDWKQGSVRNVLSNRSVLGEFTPRLRKPGRPAAGNTIPDYYPQIITPAEFYSVQDSIQSRKKQTGPSAKRVANLFTRILKCARDKGPMHITTPSKQKPLIHSAGATAGKKGSVYSSFPYAITEEAILTAIRELKPEDLRHDIPTDENLIESEKANLRDLDYRLDKIKSRLKTESDLDTLLDVVRELEVEKREIVARIEKLEHELRQAASPALQDTQSIIQQLANAEENELYDLRTSLKARIADLISEIWVYVVSVGKNKTRCCHLQIHYREGGIRQAIIIEHVKANIRSYTISTDAQMLPDDCRIDNLLWNYAKTYTGLDCPPADLRDV